MFKKLYIIIMGVVLVLPGCKKDFLDRAPLDAISDASFWKTEEQVKFAANGCYANLKARAFLDYENLGDNTLFPQSTDYQRISMGNFASDLASVNSEWTGNYDAIRRCNHFLENYKKATFINEKNREQYASEVRFLRAFAYTFLTSFFGDVQLITKTLNIDDPELYGKRDSRATVVKWIYDELDAAAANLPTSYPATDYGRVTKGAALAWKARVAIWNNQWDVAEKAAKDVMDLGVYSLYNNGNPNRNYWDLFTYKGQASINPAQKETIFARLYTLTTSAPHNLSRDIQVPNLVTRFNPTQSLVDSYLCIDGRPIDQSPLYAENNYGDIFKNRDPRLSQTILSPGSAWQGLDDGDPDNLPNPIYNLPKFIVNQNGCTTLSGYYFTKWVEPMAVPLVTQDENDIILIRYAEVLLIYAEARERQGKLTQDDLDKTINLLRARVGMPSMILTELATWGLNIRTEIQRERRVELPMEGTRYFDIIRWGQGPDLAKDQKGMKRMFAPSQADVSNLPVDANGYIIINNNRNFVAPKNNLWPMPLIQLTRNPALGKNPGW